MGWLILNGWVRDEIILDDVIHIVCLVGCTDPSIVFVWFVEWDDVNCELIPASCLIGCTVHPKI